RGRGRGSLGSVLPHRALFEEAQQLAIVRHGGGDGEVIDGRGAEAAHELLATLRRAPRDVGAPEVDEARLSRLEIDEARQRAARKTLLAPIEDRNGDDVVPAVQAVQRTLEGEVEKIGEHEHD